MNLKSCVLARKDALIACLQESLRIPSVEGPAEAGAPYGVAVKQSLDHFLASAQALGLKTVNMDGHVGWCEYGEGDEMVAVLGHLDVVPAGDGWSFDPWGGELRDGNILGRGAVDDKGPSVAALYALAALRDSGLPLRRRVRVLVGCNEETGSLDIAHYLAHGGEIPVMGFTPDGEYPVINGEKGIINVTCAADFDQTGDLRLTAIQGGTASNVVPAAAWARLTCSEALADELAALSIPKVTVTKTEDGILVEAAGVSAHGSTPEIGENANGRLVQALDRMPLTGGAKNAIHFLATAIGMESHGESLGIDLYDEVSGHLSLNWGILEGDGKGLTVKINYRYPVTWTYDDCAPILMDKFRQAGFRVLGDVHKAKLYVPEDSQLVQTLLRVYRAETGDMGPAKSIGGGTYAKALPNIVAFGPIFPGDEPREHKPNEFIEADKLVRNAQIIAEAMYQLAK